MTNPPSLSDASVFAATQHSSERIEGAQGERFGPGRGRRRRGVYEVSTKRCSFVPAPIAFPWRGESRQAVFDGPVSSELQPLELGDLADLIAAMDSRLRDRRPRCRLVVLLSEDHGDEAERGRVVRERCGRRRMRSVGAA